MLQRGVRLGHCLPPAIANTNRPKLLHWFHWDLGVQRQRQCVAQWAQDRDSVTARNIQGSLSAMAEADRPLRFIGASSRPPEALLHKF